MYIELFFWFLMLNMYFKEQFLPLTCQKENLNELLSHFQPLSLVNLLMGHYNNDLINIVITRTPKK